MSSPFTITKDTLIPIGLVIIVLSAAFSYGIMYNKVATLTVEVTSLREDVQELNQSVAGLTAKLDKQVSFKQ